MKNLKQILEWSKTDHKILAAALYPDSSESAAYQKLRLLISGKTKTFTADQLRIVCSMTGCEVANLTGVNDL